jgi:hypothetical protein
MAKQGNTMDTSMLKILCYADGGLGNRLGSLVNALWLHDQIPSELHLTWPITNWCAAPWEELFDSSPFSSLSVYRSLGDAVKVVTGNGYISSHSGIDWIGKLLQPGSYIDASTFIDMQSEDILGSIVGKAVKPEWVILNDCNPWKGISKNYVCDLCKKYLKPIPALQSEIDSFCSTNSIDKTVTGIHIRATDGISYFSEVYPQYLDEISNRLNSGTRVFVCTDSRNINDDLQQRFPGRLIIFPKDEYVEKCVEGADWRGSIRVPQEIIDQKSKDKISVSSKLDFNVMRSCAQLKSAVCDMFILAKTDIMSKTIVGSTFLDFARRLSQ